MPPLHPSPIRPIPIDELPVGGYTYKGYLEPWLDEILTKGLNGQSAHKITQGLYPRIYKRYTLEHPGGNFGGNFGSNPAQVRASIHYILTKYNIPTPRPSFKETVQERRNLAVKLRAEGLTYSEIGKQLHVTRERVGQMLLDEHKKLKVQAKRERAKLNFTKLIATLQEESYQTSIRKILNSNRGRPIDMGGPRGIWLEASPWDEPCSEASRLISIKEK